jgi:hypothetical protein
MAGARADGRGVLVCCSWTPPLAVPSEAGVAGSGLVEWVVCGGRRRCNMEDRTT